MAGTRLGGRAAAATNKRKYGPDFYQRIGAKGGRLGRGGGGFAMKIPCKCPIIAGKHYKVQCAGRKGGRKSRRRKAA